MDLLANFALLRKEALKQPHIYPQILPTLMQHIDSAHPLDQRRWGAEFLAELFASPVVTAEAKQQMCVSQPVLDTLLGYLKRKEDLGQEEDATVVKYAVQCAASVYPIVFRYTIANSSDSDSWNKMAGIKSSILRRMDTAPSGVRICCIKFVAMVVQVQTAGLIADPRRPEQNEVSLALVPREHVVLKVGNLEAEASGLLDRLLSVLQEEYIDALIVTATLNSLASLVQRRASISNKIISTVLSFNPLRAASRPVSGKDKVTTRSMTRTTASFLLNVLKRSPQHNMAVRIQQHVERLRHSLNDLMTDTSNLKRPAPDEPVDGLDDAKRQRVDANASNGITLQQQPSPSAIQLPSGPVSIAQLFTLTNDEAVRSFHVEMIQPGTVAQLAAPLLQSIDASKLEQALNIIKARYLEISRRPPASALEAAQLVAGEDDDDYDPEFASETERVENQLDQAPDDGEPNQDIAIGPFHLPPPPPLSETERDEFSKTALLRVFGTLSELDREARDTGAKATQVQKGFNILAAQNHDRDGWLSLVTRIATRANFDSQDSTDIKNEGEERNLAKKGQHFQLANGIREALLHYVMEDFRRRITTVISWLNEEWYCDRITAKQKAEDGFIFDDEDSTPNYTYWMLRFLDGILPFLDVKDNRVVVRFISEIPALTEGVFQRLKKIADDPERVTLVVQALLYLVMFRPPVRESALDAMESLWRENEDARKPVEKQLVKWRPGIIQSVAATNGVVKAES